MMSTTKRSFYVCLALISIVFAIYGYLGNCDFINYDDLSHVVESPYVRKGLTINGIQWAFTHFHASQWIPLTWVAHMVDVSLFGLNAGGHHLTAVAIHALNACLLLVALNRLTGAFWKSAAVALLFAVHPINVESVAWVAERKNVLSTLFWLLAIIAYAKHAQRPRLTTLLPVLGCMVVGLLCKGMLVTLPFTLLLLDFWPLERWRTQSWKKLVTEKIPLFAVSLISSLVTSRAAASANAIVPLEITSVFYRVCNAIANYSLYVGKLLWPENLAILYPIPAEPPVLRAVLSGIGIVVVLYASWRVRKRAPYVLVGCLWFLGTLVPVSGLVQVGMNVLADRFTYVPQIGFFVAVVWGGSALVLQRSGFIRPVALVAATVVFCLALRSLSYVQHWKDSVTVFSEAAAATDGNAIAHGNAGYALASRGALTAAIKHYEAALAISPVGAGTRANLGVALLRLGREAEAMVQFTRALADDPKDFGARLNLATHALKNNDTDAAILHLKELAKSQEEPYLVHYWLGRAWAQSGQHDKAISHYRIAVGSAPNDANATEALVRLNQVSAEAAHVAPSPTP